MPEDLDLNLNSFIGRAESNSTLVRFEDATDAHAPRLNYAVPLPGAFQGRFYMEVDVGEADWLPAASRFEVPQSGGVDPRAVLELDLVMRRDGVRGEAPPPSPGFAVAGGLAVVSRRDGTPLSGSGGAGRHRLARRDGETTLEVDGYTVPWSEVHEMAEANRSLVVYRGFGGAVGHTYVGIAIDDLDANPRFVIVEHYRLTSHFGDYGAGRTVANFSLMPGEETSLYVRNWTRTESRYKQASSIFDSFTEEAASDFETSVEHENTDKTGYAKTRNWHVEGSTSINFGIGKIGSGSVDVSAGGGGGSQRSRESMAKSASKVLSHHSSKASSKRETSVTTELEISEASEFETITQRKISNTNLSRTLNIVTRELNQEFTTYLSLIDVTVAFANDRGVFDEVRLHELDDLLSRYLPPPPAPGTGIAGPGGLVVPGAATVSHYTRIRQMLVDQMTRVFDFQGVEKQFIEEAEGFDGTPYLRVVRAADPDQPNPHYPEGAVPVEGVVLDHSRHTVRTAAVIIDSLLGHGVALDNYALGMQQESLRREQNENRKTELALSLIESGSEAQLEAYRSLFGSVDAELLREVALREEH